MVDLPALLPDEVLRRRYGSPTLDRAWDYVRAGHVLSCLHEVDDDGDLDIRGAVAGSAGAPYVVTASVGEDDHGWWASSRCSCPMRDDCKHVVALLITVRDEQARTGPDPGRRWERELAGLLDDLDARAARQTGSAPLGIRVELKAQPATGFRAVSERRPRGSLRLRPVRTGSRGTWVKTGIEWTTVRHLDRDGAAHPARQVVALNDLLTGHVSANRQIVFGVDGSIPLGGFGPDEMALLRRCVEAGVALVPGHGVGSVRLADAVTVRLDVHAPPGADAHLRLGVPLEGEWYSGDDLEVLGDGFGVALWDPAGDDRPSDGPGDWAVTLAPLTRQLPRRVRRLLAGPSGLRVPVRDRDSLVADYLPLLRRHVPLVSTDASVELPAEPEPRLVLAVDWAAVDDVRVQWQWRYRVGRDDRVYDLGETRGLRTVRRSDLEREALDALVLDDEQAYHLCRGHRRDLGLEESHRFRDGHAILFAEQLLPGLREQVEVDETGEQPRYEELHGEPVIRFTARQDRSSDEPAGRTDWLDLEVEVTVDEVPLGLATVLEALTKGMDRVILPSGRHVRIDRPEFARLAELVEAAAELHDRDDGTVRIGHRDLGLWDELAEVGIVDEQATQWVAAARALRTVDELPAVDPVGVEAELRSYQLAGFRWLAYLWQAGLGGILADDMGLGKTIQTLALVAHARAGGAGPFLVVAPTSVVSTWVAEAAQFTPDLDVRAVSESSGRRGESVASLTAGADVVVTSYTLFRLEQSDYVAQSWGGLVLDEAQTVKNHQGKTHQAVRRVDAPFRLALTGTPMENRLMELWALLSIVAPGLYPWPRRFAELVADPVEKEGDTAALERFRRRIRPFLLRRTKDLVAADLPPKQEQLLEVALTPRHRRVYDTHLQRERQAVLGLVDDFDKHRIAIFRSLTRLRQLSLDAALVDDTYDGIGSAKVDVLVDHVLELAAEGHRALVFSQFTSFLARVRARLDAEGVASSYLDGTTRHRSAVVEAFRRGDDPVFLISLKAGGVGLTLTEADYVFVLDPWWNPAVEAQAVDRAHRIGQDKPVLVYRLVAADTIEEKVMALKARKAALFAQVVQGDALSGTPLDADDVRALLE